MRIWQFMAALLLATVAVSTQAATTYNYTGQPFVQHLDHTTCTVGSCADYTTSSMVTGWFTVDSPLAANMPPANIAASVTAYSFSDGVNTISSSDPKSRIMTILVGTDSAGQIALAQVLVQQWQTASPATDGTANSRINLILSIFISTVTSTAQLQSFPGIAMPQTKPDGGLVGLDEGMRNAACNGMGATYPGAPADTCVNIDASDSNSSVGIGPGGWWGLPREALVHQVNATFLPTVHMICAILASQNYVDPLRRDVALQSCGGAVK